MAEKETKSCDADFERCKGKCFDVLTDNLAYAGDDQGKIKDARDKYLKCRAICTAAKEICEQTKD